jgi:polysaccharide biosynthesis transport protein
MGNRDGAAEAPWVVSLRTLRRRLGVVVLCTILVAASALAFSVIQEKQYAASASLLFRDPQLDQAVSGGNVLPPVGNAEREGSTNLRLLSLPVIAERTAERMDVGLERVAGKVAVEPQGDSDVFSVTATDPDPVFAARLANSFAREYVEFRRQADRRALQLTQDLVRRQLEELTPTQRQEPRGEALEARLEQLEVVASLQTGNAELVQTAGVPSTPSEPKPIRNTVLGGVLGLLLGILIAFLLERLDRRLKDPAEVGRIFDRPVLAAIPESDEIKNATSAVAMKPSGVGEAFRMLHANLRFFDFDTPVRSVAITSPGPEEGKSTVAWNLAAAAAAAASRVLLIDADLRHPAFESRYGISAPGLTAVLTGGEPAESIVSVPVTPGAGDGPAMHVLPAGVLPPNPTDLLLSDRMRWLIGEATARYDLVVIDTPPTSIVSDAIPVVKEVSGVIVVTRVGRTPREAAIHLSHQLENLGARVLGVVANGLSGREPGYYGYAYGYAPATVPEREPTPPAAKTATEPAASASAAADGPQPRRAAPTDGDPRLAPRPAAEPAAGNGPPESLRQRQPR